MDGFFFNETGPNPQTNKDFLVSRRVNNYLGYNILISTDILCI